MTISITESLTGRASDGTSPGTAMSHSGAELFSLLNAVPHPTAIFTFKNGADVFPNGDAAAVVKLAQGQLHVEEGNSAKDGHQEVGQQEGTWERDRRDLRWGTHRGPRRAIAAVPNKFPPLLKVGLKASTLFSKV